MALWGPSFALWKVIGISTPQQGEKNGALRTLSCWPFPPIPDYACSTHPARGCTLPFREILTLEDLHECTSSRTKREYGFQAHTLPANLSTLIICHWDGTLCFTMLHSSSIFHFFLALILNFLFVGRAQQQKVRAKIILSGILLFNILPSKEHGKDSWNRLK